jgi:hypothetical protein
MTKSKVLGITLNETDRKDLDKLKVPLNKESYADIVRLGIYELKKIHLKEVSA